MISPDIFPLRTADIRQILGWVICHKNVLLSLYLPLKLLFVTVRLLQVGAVEARVLELVFKLQVVQILISHIQASVMVNLLKLFDSLFIVLLCLLTAGLISAQVSPHKTVCEAESPLTFVIFVSYFCLPQGTRHSCS